MSNLKEDEIFNNLYWSINKRMLKAVGLWPYQKIHVKISIRMFLILVIHTMMIPQLIRTYYEWGKNIEIVLENITGFFYFQLIICKYITNCTAEEKLQYLYEKISADWRNWADPEERKVLAKHAQHGRFLTIGYIGNGIPLFYSIRNYYILPKNPKVYLYTAGLGFSLLPAIIPTLLDLIVPTNSTRQKALCFYGEYFVDQQVHYYELLLHTSFCVMCTIVLFTTIDSTFTCCVQHVVGMFHIVNYRLSRAFELAYEGNALKRRELDEKIHGYVISTIQLHQQSLEFTDLLQTTYTTCAFVNIAIVLLGLSLGTVDLMMSMDNYLNFTRVFFAWCGIVLHLFYICIPGQNIIDSSSTIFNSVYFSGWNSFPLKTQRLVRFMLMRNMKPCIFTAGPLLVMNMENCGVVLKSAMSYCTFMVAMT